VHAGTPTDITTEALKRIGKLYAIEAEIRGSPAEERLAVRKEQTVPLMQSRHSDTKKAFAYLLKQWDALNLYCINGWAEIGRVEMWRGGFSSGISINPSLSIGGALLS